MGKRLSSGGKEPIPLSKKHPKTPGQLWLPVVPPVQSMNVVWFKKDLRSVDHGPLRLSTLDGPTVGLFLVEPAWLQSDEFGPDHLRFALESAEELKLALRAVGIPLLFRVAEAVEAFDSLHRVRPLKQIFSHEETGLDWTYQRDTQVKAWCRAKAVPWVELPQCGVVRPLKDRNEWNRLRSQIIERPLIPAAGQTALQSPWPEGELPWELLKSTSLKKSALRGGRAEAARLLHSFLESRGKDYTREMSSPLTAFDACSRLSPYIAWGQLSITEITWAARERVRRLKESSYPGRERWLQSLRSFESRLWWHCHFVQKLESEPAIEFHPFNRQFDGMREADWDESKFEAWCRGETGFPMVDACMRALLEHGWINFRMRAMLMSFAAYQLWLHWKRPAVFLARHFSDFEPGIHYSQAQMQSGVTGINTIRIYSPRKQHLDQDPEGVFIRRYVPEIAALPDADLVEPHTVPPLLMLSSGVRLGVDYPLPIVDPVQSYQSAKQKIFEWKNRPETRKQSEAVFEKHGSRKR